MTSIFPDQNNTNFPQTLKYNLGMLKYDDTISFLKFHQFITNEYITQNPNARGLLLYFTVGFGKTILAIALARIYKKIDPTRKIIVLLSKGLIQNFKDNAKKFLKQFPEYNNVPDIDLAEDIDKSFKFISFRSNLMFKKMAHIQKTDDQMYFEEQIGNINKSLTSEERFLENTVLIIDEAHNFFNAITNGSKNSLQLYDSIMKTRDMKLFFLTGTPIVNDPFELVPCFNMLKGLIEIPSKSRRDRKQMITLFPESRKEFYNYFVDKETLDVKNKSRFQNRTMGLSSYYGDLYFEERNKDFPEQLPTIVLHVPMSPEQFSAYDVARDSEIDEASYNKKRSAATSERFTSSGSKGTYKVKTRQISNFVFPDYALGPKRGKKMQEKFIDKITDEDWNRLDVFSPKILKLLGNLKKHEGQLGFVYSEFVTGEGLAVISHILSRMGYVSWSDASSAKEFYETGDKPSPFAGKKVFAIITGDLDIEDRARIIDEFNAEDNMHGEKIALLLVNKIAAEGLDLKGVRHIHILEPFWNYSRIEQVIGRGVRYKSHENYPANERNVQTYIYLSDYPESYPKEKIKEPTTDVNMYGKAMRQNSINGKFNLSIVESSIDCLVHYESLTAAVKKKINCKLCSPTNKPMYHPIIAKDFSVPDPCIAITEYKVQATEILVEGTDEKFAYVVDSKEKPPKIYIYKFNADINGYTMLRANHPLQSVLMNKIIDTITPLAV